MLLPLPLLLLLLLLLLLFVRFIRRMLDEAGGSHVKIISKIESWHGVINYDDILAVTGEILLYAFLQQISRSCL
jgi:hypothetical protein